jgi:hypothetical protein
MRTKRSFLISPLILLLALSLSGCASPAAADDTVVLSDIYTAVALTVGAATRAVTPTATLPPTSTSYPTSVSIENASATATTGTNWYPTSYASGCDNAAYVSDVTISDGTELAPGETFTKTWELANTGSCTWSKAHSITFVSGDDMDGSETGIHQSVAPGDYADISVSLTAPDDEGTYIGYWRLADKSGRVFGEQVYVQIVVSEAAATSTATATPTSTSTSIPPTGTPTPTSIPPTDTPTATPVPLISTDAPTSIPTSTSQILPMDTPSD